MENPFETILNRIENIEKTMESINAKLSKINFNELTNEANNKMFNVEELCEYLHLARQTIYGMIGERRFPYYKNGKRLYFKKKEIDEWINKSRRKTNTEIQEEATAYNQKRMLRR